ASHEEVVSMNEELQSTNEEMETSKEELQSLNEELSTVNSQLQDKVHELDGANDDMLNLLASTEIAAVFLDADLRIKRYTPPTVKLLNLLPTDVGRPFRDLAPWATDAALLDACRRVLDTLTPLEAVVRVDHAEAYLRRVLPYRTSDRRVAGIVITWIDITKRLAAEAETRHLTAVLRDSNDAVALVDLDGRITGWNRGAALLYGYTEAEARALRVRDLAPAPLQSAVDDLVTRLARGEVASESIETQRRTKDGQVREIWSTMTLLRDAAGDADAVVVTDRDVTELKEAIAGRQAAMFYEQVIENLPAGAVLRANGRLTLNRAAEVITGHSRGELSSVDAWCALLHGDSAEAFRAFYEAGPSGEHGKETAQLAITRRDGAVRHVECSTCRLNATQELWLLRDVTDADEAELALRRSEDYLRSIVDTAADGIITIDEQGVIDTFNRAAERMFGYTATEMLGRKVNLLMPPPFCDEHEDYLARYVKTREARIIGIGREVMGRRKDGTTFPLALSVSEIDNLGRFAGVLHDLSERQALEWRLAESQLEERRHMSRELHDEVGGHMTGIGLMAQGLQAELERVQSPLADRVRDLTHSIGEAQQRVRGVIHGLMPVEEIPEGLMAALRVLVQRHESASGIPCRFICEPPVRVDDPTTAKHVFRIAQEALTNAVRHANASKIVIRLERHGPMLRVDIDDDGIGLTVPESGHGGMGLLSMRQRAQLLGGSVVVQLRPGGGTMVRCSVPETPRHPRARRADGPGARQRT
ncbi:MAG TPA: PAS domain S-box protein, partial [Thermoleophilia bacterium]|nr:PAS domain S-box protein [Thermoleophilia bacterium]